MELTHDLIHFQGFTKDKLFDLSLSLFAPASDIDVLH